MSHYIGYFSEMSFLFVQENLRRQNANDILVFPFHEKTKWRLSVNGFQLLIYVFPHGSFLYVKYST